MPRNKFILRRPFPYVYRRTALSIIFINFVIFGLGFLYPNLNEYVHYYGAMNPILVVKGHMYWQFISYMFVHQNISHVFFNMLALLVFGLNLEKAIGSREFLLFYLVCGALSGFFSFLVYWFTGYYGVFLLGASGAVYAVLFAYAVFFPRSVIFIWGIVPVPALEWGFILLKYGKTLTNGKKKLSRCRIEFDFCVSAFCADSFCSAEYQITLVGRT